MKEIYTIGHSTYPVEYLLKRLLFNKINCIVDVRSTPYSKYAQQYNMDELKKYLNSKGIYYLFMGKELGARQPDKSLYTDKGYLDFNKFSKTDLFKSGVERIKEGINKDFKIALMCTEKDPIDCHRNILVAREFYKQDYEINNILANGNLETQGSIEQRLLDMYFPSTQQANMFETIERDQNELDLINEAYKLRNQDIGYKIYENGDEP